MNANVLRKMMQAPGRRHTGFSWEHTEAPAPPIALFRVSWRLPDLGFRVVRVMS